MSSRTLNCGVSGLKLWALVGMLVVSLVSIPAAARADDVVLDWNGIAARTVTAGQSPFAQARLMAITQLAVFEAVHASGTNGGLEMMRRLFGAAGHDITFSNTVPALRSMPATVISRHYTQLKQIADDVDDARVYGGIHYRFDQEGGNVLGRAIATEIYKNYLRPVHGQQ